MRKPLVSVGIPYTDQGHLLALAVRSVLNQTFQDWELILYGDGPDPDTRGIAESFSDDRIRHYVNQTRGGLSAALNSITDLSRGDLIARMDGDDLMHPDRLQKQFSFLQSHPEVDVLGTMAYLIDEETRLVGLYKEPSLPTETAEYLRSNSLTHPTIMARREWFLAHKYDESLLRAEDKELWLRTNSSSTFAKMDEPLLYYRIPRSVSWRRQSRDSVYDRKIMRAYSHLASPADIRGRLLKSYVKQVLVFCFAQLQMLGPVYRNKYSVLSTVDHENASSVLKTCSSPLTAGLPPVLAITVTYGQRLHLVEQTTNAALAAGATKVLIINNGMTKDTASSLDRMYSASPSVDILTLEVNEGSATGFHAGLRTALESQFDYFLLLDDDNVIVRGHILDLMTALEGAQRRSGVAGVAAVREVDERHRNILQGTPVAMTYPPAGAFMYFDAVNFIMNRLTRLRPQRNGNTSWPPSIPTAPYGGLFTDRHTLNAVGLPNKGLGLYEDDTEWTSRIARQGKLVLAPSVVIEDLVGKHSEVSEGRGPERLLCSESKARVFFAVRNRVHWERTQAVGLARRFRYRINRTIYLKFITSKAEQIGANAALQVILAAVRDGEADDLSTKLTDMAAEL